VLAAPTPASFRPTSVLPLVLPVLEPRHRVSLAASLDTSVLTCRQAGGDILSNHVFSFVFHLHLKTIDLSQ